MKYRLLSLLLLLFVAVGAQSAGDFPPVPNPVLPVNDYAQLLQPDEVSRLNAKLTAYRDSTSTEIVIVTVDDLKGYDPLDYAQRLGELWGVGGKKDDNGVMVVVSTNPRKITISTGYGVEDRVTDAVSSQIIRNTMGPAFKQGKYYQGFDEGTNAIISALAGRYKAVKKPASGNNFFVLIFIAVIVLIIVFISKRGGNQGPRNGNRKGGFGNDWAGPIFWGSAWGSGGGSWGGSGGGGSSGWGGFGGGSFGGGGASGDW